MSKISLDYFIYLPLPAMGRVNTPILTAADRPGLEDGFKHGKPHCFRMRCHCILLKAEGRTSEEVGSITGMCDMSVNHWVKRFKSEGIKGLHTKQGQGRKPIINEVEDKAGILKAIKANRQGLQAAKAQWEVESGKSVCSNTFKTFLKSLAENINV